MRKGTKRVRICIEEGDGRKVLQGSRGIPSFALSPANPWPI